MEYKNKLRIYRDDIKEFFIHEFAGIGENLEYYVPVSLPLKWLNNYGNHPIKKINVSDYEETLIKFIENPENISAIHPLLIIIGGSGTGKSTSIKYAINKANICQGCPNYDDCQKNYPARIHLDFLNFKKEAEVHGDVNSDESNNNQKAVDRFWSYISKNLRTIIDNKLDVHEEVTNFWNWLINNAPEGRHSHIFNKRLEAIMHLFKNPAKNSGELLNKKAELYNNFTEQELVFYKLYQIAYLRRTQKVNCNLLIFDNIDRLDPGFQSDIINFTIEANNAFGCKAIIPMRPNTFHLNRDASDCIEIIEHCIPNIQDVLNKRLNKYKQKGDSEVYFIMKKIVEYIFANSTMREVFYSSSGSSIRFALRNLYNLFLSPLIVTHTDNKQLDSIDFDAHIFFQAFFCSESSTETLFENNFVNILAIRRSKGNAEYSNIKLRALHLLYSLKEVKAYIFASYLESFGYSIDDILLTINEFLDNKKSLMWSNAVSEYDDDGKLKSNKKHAFYITPMGESYYEILITHPSYLFECIFSIDTKREKYLSQNMTSLADTLKNLFYIDLNEIKEYLKIYSISEYRKMFSVDKPSISSILYFKMNPNFEILVRNIPFDKFDRYENYMAHEVNKLISE